MNDPKEIETGVESESEVPADADVFAYADDGEHAIVWAVTRNDDYEVSVTAWLGESGTFRRDGAFGLKHFGLDPSDDTKAWALDYAKGHKRSIEHARALSET